MGRKIIILFLGGCILLLSAFAQTAGASYVYRPTPDIRIFPSDLFCEEAETSLPTGAGWNFVEIGSASLDGFRAYFGYLNLWKYREWTAWDDTLIFEGGHLDDQNVGPWVQVCIVNNVVMVLKVYPLNTNLSSFVANYGVPDTVTWSSNSPSENVAFWFERGIAVQFNAAANDYGSPNINSPYWGIVSHVTYFPPQPVEGYENRWPYNRTRRLNFPLGANQPIGTQNPVNYDVMIATMTAQPLPTMTEIPLSELRIFPRDLSCDQIEGVSGLGPTWESITIGQSTVTDLENYFASLGTYTKDFFEDGRFIYVTREKDWLDRTGVTGCAIDNIIVALQFRTATPFNLRDFMVRYGIPDAQTWSSNSPYEAVVFWFEHGIALQVSTGIDDYGIHIDSPFYGDVSHITYFPYQSADRYETRWPYNRTRGEYASVFPENGIQNPFDFYALMATVTAQPSRTATPTFMP